MQQTQGIIEIKQMIPLEEGTFWMGDDNSDYEIEKPAHLVKISPFSIGKYPITQSFWQEVMGNTDITDPAYFKGKNRPIESVSWEDAIQFCNKLSQIKNKPAAYDKKGNYLNEQGNPTKDITKVKGYRLPTEAEWEYAAIGGHLAKKENEKYNTPIYRYAGSNRLEEVGWYDENSYRETKDVGLKLPNRLGVYDMSGNVWEWCGDWYDGKYYQKCKEKGIITNPLGAESGRYRVLRGGSYFNTSQNCRVADRNDWYPDYRLNDFGFRLALSLQSVG